MKNEILYRCIKCNSSFDYYQLKADLLSCPSCGGYLEDSTSKKNDRSEGAGTSAETMKSLPTHYENLKVAKNAPPEVIRAAYRVLAQKHHPDSNPGSEEDICIMKTINTSYAVLSDPIKRKEYDRIIDACKRPYSEPSRPAYPPRSEAAAPHEQYKIAPGPDVEHSAPIAGLRTVRRLSKRSIMWVLLGLLFIFGGGYDLWTIHNLSKIGTHSYLFNADGSNYEGKDSYHTKPASRNIVVLYNEGNTAGNKSHKYAAIVAWAFIVLGIISLAFYFEIL